MPLGKNWAYGIVVGLKAKEIVKIQKPLLLVWYPSNPKFLYKPTKLAHTCAPTHSHSYTYIELHTIMHSHQHVIHIHAYPHAYILSALSISRGKMVRSMITWRPTQLVHDIKSKLPRSRLWWSHLNLTHPSCEFLWQCILI